ncbi:RNA polymerase sigma factor SigY [Paenibacillus alginolyticus]|uniref:RNA polymerase sigma factor SigY n=1 Tax=Paenibacillus alginolyticus TaxID=59839 RepID=UPI002DBDC6B4|nr:RNA polymerase sigma factor SigY [Paenibacillus alginolyticus]MEC0147779.1 RNA polymerase sigma factor SigY [Paenibacillus alginolyticus]
MFIHLEEHELIRQAIQGDKTALSQLLQQHYAFVYKYLLKITLDSHMSEDIAQETMVKCIEKIRLYNGQSKFSSWLITIATNLFLDQTRRKKREKLWQQQEQDQSLRRMQWQAGQQNENWPEVLNALSELQQEARIPVILKHYYGYTYEEIGHMLEIAEGTVKSRVHHALKQLRKELA